jgi:hypothetical protein
MTPIAEYILISARCKMATLPSLVRHSPTTLVVAPQQILSLLSYYYNVDDAHTIVVGWLLGCQSQAYFAYT